jgi:hypothetical protein
MKVSLHIWSICYERGEMRVRIRDNLECVIKMSHLGDELFPKY